MFKKSRVTDLKHRNTRKKLKVSRALARQLIKGDVAIDQLGRLAGEAGNGVLRMVNYLSETEGITLTSSLSQAVAQAVSPGSSSSSAILARRAAAIAAAPKASPAVKPEEPIAIAEEPVSTEPAIGTTTAEAPLPEPSDITEPNENEPPQSEEVEPAIPKKRTRSAAKVVAPLESESAPKPKTRTSAKAKTAAKQEEADPGPKKRVRSTAKAAETKDDADKATPKKRTRAVAKPKE